MILGRCPSRQSPVWPLVWRIYLQWMLKHHSRGFSGHMVFFFFWSTSEERKLHPFNGSSLAVCTAGRSSTDRAAHSSTLHRQMPRGNRLLTRRWSMSSIGWMHPNKPQTESALIIQRLIEQCDDRFVLDSGWVQHSLRSWGEAGFPFAGPWRPVLMSIPPKAKQIHTDINQNLFHFKKGTDSTSA